MFCSSTTFLSLLYWNNCFPFVYISNFIVYFEAILKSLNFYQRWAIFFFYYQVWLQVFTNWSNNFLSLKIISFFNIFFSSRATFYLNLIPNNVQVKYGKLIFNLNNARSHHTSAAHRQLKNIDTKNRKISSSTCESFFI